MSGGQAASDRRRVGKDRGWKETTGKGREREREREGKKVGKRRETKRTQRDGGGRDDEGM